MRAIDGDALIQKRRHAKDYDPEMYVIGQGYVMDAPTLDTVKRGEWEEIEPEKPTVPFDVMCPLCEALGFSSDSFCARCGADMRKEDTNAD